MADAYRGLMIEFNGDTTKLSKALSQINKETRTTGTALAQVERGLKFNPGNTTLVTQQQKYLRDSIGLTAQKLEQLKKTNESYSKATRPLSKEEAAGWEKVQREIVTTESTLKHYRQTLAESVIGQGLSESSLQKFGSSIESFGKKVEPAGARLESFGRGLSATLTPAIIAAGTGAFMVASDFESSMSRVAGALNDPSANMEALSDLALQMGQDTIFSATEAGAAMEELAKGGLTAADIEGGALATTMSLAAAGGLDLSVAANTVVQSMGAFGLSANQTGEAANALAGAAAASSADVSELTQGLSQVSAQSHSAGWSIQDTTAVLGGFADAGIKGSDAGTSLKTMLQRLAAPTDSAAAAIDTLGINIRDSDGNMLNAAGVAQELQNKLGGLSSAEKDAAMQSIFGADASRAALVMTNLGREGVEKYTSATNDQNAAQRLSDSQMGESQRAIEEMKGAIETAAIKIGSSLSPSIVGVAEAVASAAEKFSSMDEETQKAIIQAVALSAALGPVLSIFGKGIKTIEGFGRGLQTMARFFAEVELKTSGTSKEIKELSSATKKSEEAAQSQTTALKASSVGMGMVKTAAAGLALAGIALVIAEIVKYVDHQKKLDKATSGLKSSLGAMNEAFLSSRGSAVVAVESSEKYTKSLLDIRDESNRVIEKQADLATSISESFSAAGTSIGLLDSYKKVISELAGESDLTAEKQAELKVAVDGVNGICGTNYTVVKDAGGAYEIMQDGAILAKDAILKLIEAQEIQIRLDADKAAYEDTFKQHTEAAKVAAEATNKYNEVMAKHEEEVKKLVSAGGTYEEAQRTVAAAEKIVKDEMEKSNTTLDAAKDAMSKVADEQLLLTQAINEGDGSVSKYVASNDFLLASLSGAGKNCREFSSTLAGVGANVDNLGELNDAQLSNLAIKYDGTYSSIAGLLREYGVNVDEAMAKENIARDDASKKTNASLDGMKKSMNLYSENVKTALLNAGMSSDDFVGKLAAAGVSTNDFRALSSEQLALLVSSYDGNIEKTKAKLDEFVVKNGEAGAKGVSSFATSLSAGALQAVIASQSVTNQSLAQFEADCVKYGISGDAAVSAYATALTNGATPAQAASSTMGATGAFGANRSGLFSISAQSNLDAFNARLAGAAGTTQSGSNIAIATTSGISSQNQLFGDTANGVISIFNGAVSRAEGTKDAGKASANEAKEGMRSQNNNAGQWGRDLTQNFANGISEEENTVKVAANNIGSIIKRILGHTVPEEGPLRNGGKGETEWGAHTVQNYVAGIRSQIPELKKAMTEVSAATAMPMASSERLRISSLPPTASLKSAASSISDNPQESLTKADVYDAMSAALSSFEGGKEVALYIDGRELTGALSGHIDTKFGVIRERRLR